MGTTASQQVNGVDVQKLTDTIDLIREQPELARFRFRAATQWQGGGAARTRIQGFFGAGQEDSSRSEAFELSGDEPPVLLGDNTAPNAVEAVLHALSSCVAVGMAYNAAARGINIRRLDLMAEGELDLHGFLGLDPDTRAGYSTVQLDYQVDTDATPEEVDDLCEHVQRTSPVLDMLRNNVTVDVRRRR